MLESRLSIRQYEIDIPIILTLSEHFQFEPHILLAHSSSAAQEPPKHFEQKWH